MLLTKTVEESDYQLIAGEVSTLETVRRLLEWDIVDDWVVSHKHRKWEWGMALKAIQEWLNFRIENLNPPRYPITVLDVGSGDGMLGPTIEWMDRVENKFRVVEIEPRATCKDHRKQINRTLGTNLEIRTESLEESRGCSADIITCISVLEHVQDDMNFLDNLIMTLKPGGLLFLTTDVMPVMPGHYHFDNLRTHNYTMFDICKMLEGFKKAGLEPLGEVDLNFRGAQVYDYSFASICVVSK